ncbi:hypothetical protein R1flu_003463 [Riccia fluitans]|uniref:ABC transporter domain-containing protein n=1 Tax=Riccia fluitans TaxID=41844 RepID=A0ABD1Y943_9MARC
MVLMEESGHENSVSKKISGRREGGARGSAGADYREFDSSPAVFSDRARRSGHEDWTVNMETLQPDGSGTKPKLQPPVPITVKFEDVCYSVSLKPQTTWWDFKSWGSKIAHHADEKSVLKDMIGVVRPGEMLAMLGPSGSGKTTLLNILGGRVIKGNITGKILYNDMPYDKVMKRRTGFVTQDDVLLPHLTVKETLVYAALLRLPREFSRQDKIKRAEDVIMELGLDKCKNTIIGGAFLRGVSGGERKRVSIAHEMLIDPSLLLLDEPTSGLDSTIALRIILTLQNLARGGRTIITTIHQPSSVIFHLFDKLLLLSEGHTIYFGPRIEAMSYFDAIGFRPSFETNPADFLLDLANGVQHEIDPLDRKNHDGKISSNKTASDIQALRKTLREAYVETLVVHSRNSLERAVSITVEQKQGTKEKSKWPSTWWEQFSVLIVRSMRERRHEVFSGLRICQVLAVSIICGMLWFQSTPDQIQDQVGLLFFITTFWGFYPIFTAIFTFPTEREMLAKERASGMYRLTAYFLARTVGDLPLELVLPTVSHVIVYWMGGLKATAGAYFSSYLTILFIVLVAQGLGLLLGAAMMDVKKATTLASVIVLTFQLAGGYFVQNTPAFIGWLKYLSFSYYAYKLQLATQYTEMQTYACGTGRCLIVDYPAVKQMGIDRIGVSVMALSIMLVGYRFLAYLALRNMKK